MAVYKRDIADINLETGNIHRTFLNHSIGLKDQKADHFGVRVFRDGEPVNLSGVSVQGVFMPPQGSPIAITSGNIVSGNVAEVVLPQACYNYDGQFCLAIKLVDATNSVTGTVRIVDGMVDNTHASGTVAPTSAVPTYQEVLSVYEQAIAAISTVNAMAGKMAVDITAGAEATSNNSFKDLGNRWMTFRRGYYSTPSAGSTSSYTDDVNYVYALVACAPGDVLHAHGYGDGTSKSAWAFLDSSLKILDKGGSGNYEGETDPAPTSTAFALVNVKLASLGSGYYGWTGPEAIKDQIATLKDAVSEDGNIIYSRDLKSALNASDDSIINVPYDGSFDIESGGIYSDGTNTTNSKRARTTFVRIVPGQKYRVKLTDHDYSFLQYSFIYSSASVSSAINAVDYMNQNRDEIIFKAGTNGHYFRAGFYYTTNTDKVLDSTDYAAIKAGLSICEYTDMELENAGSAADAKVTGDVVKTMTVLPFGYQQVEYLESSGTQSIIPTASGKILDQDSRVIIQFAQTEDGIDETNYLFGSRYNTSSKAFYVTIRNNGKVDFGYKTTYNTDAVINDADIHFIDCNKNKLYLDGKLIATASEVEFETPTRGALFAIYASSSSSYMYGKTRLYGYKQYDDGTLVADCVPCKRLSDNALGVYNFVTGAFCENNGTGSLVAGDNVNIQSINNELKEKTSQVEREITDCDNRITDLQTEIDELEVKSYIKTEADRVSEKVRSVQTGESLSFIAVSDMHYSVDSVETQNALEDMSNAVIKIAEQVHIDFYTCFGDVIYRLRTDGNYEKGTAEAIGATRLLSNAFSNNQQIRLVGNHDPNAEATSGYFTPNMMNSFAGIYSNMLTKNPAVQNGGYGYCDFERQKIRLIALNTSYYASSPTQHATQYTMGNDQAIWLGDALDISDKDGYEDWQIVIFAHIGLDWLSTGTTTPVDSGALSKYTRIFNAYETGGEWSAGTYSKNYSGKNAAKLAIYMNGHQHAYIIKNLNYYNMSNAFVRALKLANLYVPNALPSRDFAGTDGVVYTKTANSATSTAFQVVTIDPVNKVVYAHHYGAGIDMIVHYESQEVASSASLTTGLTSPTWDTNDSSIATVSSGTVTAVAAGNTMIWAKSTTDNCIEAWNINVPA